MKKYLLAAILAAVIVSAGALYGNGPVALYTGGDYDGYGQGTTSVTMSFVPDAAHRRYYGGNYGRGYGGYGGYNSYGGGYGGYNGYRGNPWYNSTRLNYYPNYGNGLYY